ncbi:MAG: metalloregulator ArsR/SmtB family transcription factor [Candidatus Cloacimonetes bacterium]|nr:metalloregulator ArsR/SmtB family transcription factor [Candidatus Cloacimonadota bacterium]MDY0337277.1 metalloregulator ArsR/SmtB family transcription factor [Candidatus Cloacimonadaceae bacterium]MCB5268804.1 metalloregulator ArsR/SmtB family transcription factor [Candidatus Cloacimonadota bacterium]MCK9333719.1 metalloregulator ArsR/SmtB family transcription factor [Candidatus Cloacimonadota bacterium]MDD2543247.1 metalloregulator ArsR/SmtB family transcription factor [Candidatus Cloacim
MTDLCKCKQISDKEMQSIIQDMPDAGTMQNLADFFKVFGDFSRLKLLYFLSRTELCVADLSALANMQQSAVSHQLKILRLNRLVKTRKEGTVVYYSLDDMHIKNLFDLALEHLEEQK